MNIFEIVIINIILIMFPIFCYLFYNACFKDINEKINSLVLSLALFTSFYLDIRFAPSLPLVSFNIVLLIGYLKNKKVTALILSLLFISYYTYYFHLNVYLLIFEYAIYYLLFLLMRGRKWDKLLKINIFIFIKGTVFSFIMFHLFNKDAFFIYNFIDILLTLVMFYLISNLSLLILDKCENIMSLNNSLKELEKEKTLKESLFKITHEIKNPLAVIKGYLDMIDFDNPEKLKKHLPIIKSEVNRTLTLMDDFLDYTKIKINKDIIDIYMLLEEVIKVIKQLVNYHDVILEVNIPDDELFLLADYERLKQVLINILKNAVEAKDTTKVMKIVLEAKATDGEVIIEIWDNGVGMDAETLKNCGQMFYSTKKKGTGLGISLSKEIIRLHEGTIKYESVKGSYTKVIITLPIDKQLKTA